MSWETLGSGGIFAANPLFALGIGALAGFLLHALFWGAVKQLGRRTETPLDDSLARHLRRPTRPIALGLCMVAAVPGNAAEGVVGALRVATFLQVLTTLGVAWTAIAALSVLEDLVTHRYDVDQADNERARAIHTQFDIGRRIVTLAILVLAGGILLAGSEYFRELGTGILASAGLVGLAVGLAAQKTLANLLAGLQIAITQPVSLDDVVVVDGEYGRLEEVTLTYAVVRCWDRRALVVPISTFLERPFRSYTRNSTATLGTVFFELDYAAPVDVVREALAGILTASPHWDGDVSGVQVTEVKRGSVQLRVLVSASDAGHNFDLCCEVREGLLAFLQREFPEALPRFPALEVR